MSKYKTFQEYFLSFSECAIDASRRAKNNGAENLSEAIGIPREFKFTSFLPCDIINDTIGINI